MKTCTKCKKEQPLSRFKAYSRSKDKLDYWCKDCNRSSSKRWLDNNPDKKKEYSDKVSRKQKEQRKTSPQVLRGYDAKYYQNNKEKIVERTKTYTKNKYHTDPIFKLTSLLRGRVREALKKYKGVKKASKTTELVGCSIEALKTHLELLFTEGMTWQNQGEWHIDHKIPCSKFDLSDFEQQRICFHYTNLQPLWAQDNQKKSNKLE